MANELRWLVSELRARGFDCFREYETVTVVVLPERDGEHGAEIGGVFFDVCWFQNRWYLGACARRGVTYLLPKGADVVEVCVEWAARWLEAPPAGPAMMAAAPPEVVARFELHQLSRAELKSWFDAMFQWAMRRTSPPPD